MGTKTGLGAWRGALPGDVVAGVSVALLAIPQGVAYAQLAGVPAGAGLAAAAAAALGGAVFASSPYLQTGPTALTSLLTFGALGALVGTGELALEHAMLLALLIGVIRIVLALARGGALAFFLSDPMIAGLLPGAAVAIAITQVPDLFGASAVPRDGIFERFAWVLGHPGAWDVEALVLAAVGLLVLVGARRLGLALLAVPALVAGGIVWSAASGYAGPRVGSAQVDVPASPLSLPWGDLDQLLLPAAIIAVVGFVEPAAIGRAFLERQRRWDADRELLSQGVANLASGFAGGFPVSGSLSRSVLNRQAGARTRLSGAITGAAVLCFLPAAFVLEDLPRAVPAALVVAAVAGLVRPGPLLRLARSSQTQFGVALATFGLTLGLAPRIDRAVAIGIGLAVAVHLWREMRVPVAVRLTGDELHVRPAGVLWFGSASRFEDAVLAAVHGNGEARSVTIHLDGLGRIDLTGARTLVRLLADLRALGLDARLEGIPPVTGGMIGRVLADAGLRDA